MKAIWNGQVIAEADKKDLIYIERTWYFPRESIKEAFLRKSETPYTCPWRGVAQYYDVGQGDHWDHDIAIQYPHPPEKALHIVKKDFSNHIAFWRDVNITE